MATNVVTMNCCLPRFDGLRPMSLSSSSMQNLVCVNAWEAHPLHMAAFQVRQPMVMVGRKKGNGALGTRSGDFIGSPTNLIMITTTSLMLFAGRFGLAPSANRRATAGLKLEARDSGLQTGDPAGFTLADTLACGSVGHIIGVGVVLGLKNIGAL